VTKIPAAFHKRLGLIAALALACLAMPAAARADWDWTRWGMPASEVIAGSKGEVAPVDGAPGQRVNGWDLKATGDIRRDGLAFRAELFFDPDGQALHLVRLTLEDPGRCPKLLKRLRQRHGAPRDESVVLPVGSERVTLTLLKWDDDGRGNFLALTALPPVGESPGQCFIRYRPLTEPDPRQ